MIEFFPLGGSTRACKNRNSRLLYQTGEKTENKKIVAPGCFAPDAPRHMEETIIMLFAKPTRRIATALLENDRSGDLAALVFAIFLAILAAALLPL